MPTCVTPSGNPSSPFHDRQSRCVDHALVASGDREDLLDLVVAEFLVSEESEHAPPHVALLTKAAGRLHCKVVEDFPRTLGMAQGFGEGVGVADAFVASSCQ